MLRGTTKRLYEKDQPAFCCQKGNSKPSDLCDQQKHPRKILLRVLRSGSLRVHMDDKATETNEGMCNQGGFDSLMHVRALNGRDNIQKLLFSCAGGRCWEILQSMWVVARERQEIRKRRKKRRRRRRGESVKQFWDTIFQNQEHHAGREAPRWRSVNTADTFALKPVANYQLINVVCLRTAFIGTNKWDGEKNHTERLCNYSFFHLN